MHEEVLSVSLCFFARKVNSVGGMIQEFSGKQEIPLKQIFAERDLGMDIKQPVADKAEWLDNERDY
ncbi:hypothetical protein [Pontibacter sp. G13]|uniref:hypothetical protein n=1 Tax=Pontibacter sp. G13 TaxID=3074898 RepID=UPI00288AF37D|nr:hypothetical protein [Pontibacter sp. G13]WNJ17815.1 hypothetical protein RJD25_23430 [Pontibacter sp. G13]